MDILTKKMFEQERWEAALEKAVDKGIDKGDLRALSTPDVRARFYTAVRDGAYAIAPPHQALIPKDNGEFRTVYVNENIDRVFLSIANDLLFELFPDMIHPSCTSYQKGIGCGKVVQKVASIIEDGDGSIYGFKSDLSKYFDSVPIRFIDGIFDELERRIGKSPVLDVIREYYHTDLCFDPDGNLIEHYQSLKQGCAVAAFLADAMLYHLDDTLSKLNGFYVRYSDDCLFVGPDYEKAMRIMKEELAKMEMSLNPKKVEYLSNKKFFKFLGFSIKGKQISISKNRLKTFQKEIEARTIKQKKISLEKAINKVNRYLYKGNGEYAWAEQILGVVNVVEDINEMNEFVMDALRAVATGKKKIGGLGYVPDTNKRGGVVVRGIGRNVKANKEKTEKLLENYKSLMCMRNALVTDKAVYNTLTMAM